MDKTTFIKIPVSERLPNETKIYFTSNGLNKFSNGKFEISREAREREVEWWLEEVPPLPIKEEAKPVSVEEEKMKFSEWTKRTENHIIDNAAGDGYESLRGTSKACIDAAIEEFIEFRASLPRQKLPSDEEIEQAAYLYIKKFPASRDYLSFTDGAKWLKQFIENQ
jgi:hypothetical protein